MDFYLLLSQFPWRVFSLSKHPSAALMFTDVRAEWDAPERDFTEQEAKGTLDWVNHSVERFQREFNCISYMPHSLKEIVRSSTWCSDKEITDFPVASRKLLTLKKKTVSYILSMTPNVTCHLPYGFRLWVISSISVQKAVHTHYKQFGTNKKYMTHKKRDQYIW